MSFAKTYQVRSLEWRRDLQVDDIEDELAEFSSRDETISITAPADRLNVRGDHVPSIGSPHLELTQAVLAVCLNLGNAQSSRAKTEETFFDPATRQHERAMRKIMANLASQLTSIQEMSILALPDPRQETVISALQRARRASPGDQILFLYNDHGTLAPTTQGEIWVYDTDFPVTPTTYNPIFVSSLMDITKPGTVYIWDCDNAGRVVDCAIEHGKRKDLENRQRSAHLPQSIPPQLTHAAHDIHFGACATEQVLPVLDDLPRDVFTSCMTKPLQMAIRFHSLEDILNLGPVKNTAKTEHLGNQNITLDHIPGEVDNRDSPLGELDWLFTVIVDTIAWQCLPLETFRTLFRTNNALRCLSRGFILAQRVLRNYDCTPVCYPDIPSTHLHPLWQVWDTALEDFLCQLPIVVPVKGEFYVYRSPILFQELLQSMAAQLTLFAQANMNETDRAIASRLCANAMPIVLSACKSGRYRQWALNLLARYLDIGGLEPIEWVVNCGVFDTLPSILQWTSIQEASVAVFVLQRLMLHENGIYTLISKHNRLHKLPINLLGDFLQQHISTDSLNFHLPADTIAGVLYLFTKAEESVDMVARTHSQTQWSEILGVVVNAQDGLVRLSAVLGLASCSPDNIKVQHLVRELACTDESETIRTAAAFAIWCWQGSVTRSPQDGAHRDEELQLLNFICELAEDASFHVRTPALSLAIEFANLCSDGIIEHVKQRSARNEERVPSTYDNLVTTLARALKDPLLFLREAVAAFLEGIRSQQNICSRQEWFQVFPYNHLNDQMAPQSDIEQLKVANASPQDKPSGSEAVAVAPTRTANSRHQRPLASQILSWRDRQELYFHQTRLTWADSKSVPEETEVSKNKLRSEQITAYETGHRAIRSWTKHRMEIPTKIQTHFLSFHSQSPIIAYGRPNGYQLSDYSKKSTVARRTLPIEEQGVAALYFVNQASPGLDVIELSRQGIVRVVKAIEHPVEDDSNIVRGFRLHDDIEEVKFNAAWNATKLELHVALSSDEHGFQIWDLASSRRKAYVPTEFAVGISCMNIEQLRGNLNLTGFSDGTVALFDTRQQARRGVCRWTRGHKDVVLSSSLTASQEIVTMGKDGALQVWDLRVPNQAICSTAGPDSRRSIAAAAMSSTSVFAQLLRPVDSLPEVELSIHKLAFPAPAEIANITLSSNDFADSMACMAFHPKAARLAIAEKNKIVIRTANGER